MKKYLLMLLVTVSTSVFVGCQFDDEIDPPNYVTFERDNAANLRVDIGGSTTKEITIYTANITGNDRTFELVANEASTLSPEAYSLPASVTVPGGTNEATFTVEVSDMNLGLEGKKLVIDLVENENLSAGAPYTISVDRKCEGTEFVVAFAFDGYASEIGWTLEDADGNVLITGGGYKDGAKTATRTLCPGQGSYTFTVTDSYGDGLTYPNTGSITLSYAGEQFAVIPGAFGEEAMVEFTIGPDGASTDGGDTDGGDTDGGDGTDA